MAEYSCLIVEDSPMMRQLLVFALARVKNLRVTEADDGVDGLRKLAGARFDIIITDMQMPCMGGSELISVLKSKPETANIPIVIVTARSNGFDSKETRAQFTIFKDIDIEEQLEKALASTLKGRTAKGQASAK